MAREKKRADRAEDMTERTEQRAIVAERGRTEAERGRMEVNILTTAQNHTHSHTIL